MVCMYTNHLLICDNWPKVHVTTSFRQGEPEGNIYPPTTTTTRVKISQHFDIHCTSQGLSSALKRQRLSNLTRSKSIYRSKWVDCFWPVKALSGIVQDGQNDSKKQSKCPCVHIWVNSKKRQLTGFDLYSNFWQKCSNSRRVNAHTMLERHCIIHTTL